MEKYVHCAGTKKDGSSCAAFVEPPQEFCWWHDPANSEQRSKSASTAAKSKHQDGEVVRVKRLIQELIDDVRHQRIERGDAAVMMQGYGVLRQWSEQGRKNRETEQLAAQIEELQEYVEHQRQSGGGWYGYGS